MSKLIPIPTHPVDSDVETDSDTLVDSDVETDSGYELVDSDVETDSDTLVDLRC